MAKSYPRGQHFYFNLIGDFIFYNNYNLLCSFYYQISIATKGGVCVCGGGGGGGGGA